MKVKHDFSQLIGRIALKAKDNNCILIGEDGVNTDHWGKGFLKILYSPNGKEPKSNQRFIFNINGQGEKDFSNTSIKGHPLKVIQSKISPDNLKEEDVSTQEIEKVFEDWLERSGSNYDIVEQAKAAIQNKNYNKSLTDQNIEALDDKVNILAFFFALAPIFASWGHIWGAIFIALIVWSYLYYGKIKVKLEDWKSRIRKS